MTNEENLNEDRDENIKDLQHKLLKEQILQSTDNLDMVTLLKYLENILDLVHAEIKVAVLLSDEVKRRTILDAQEPLDPNICQNLPPLRDIASNFNKERLDISNDRSKLFDLMMNLREIEKVVIKSVEEAQNNFNDYNEDNDAPDYNDYDEDE